ncbi:MAG: efflux RND transporter periplasmic adaptor subunit [Cyanothece sp. SIO2G6]|nr:efflux RND transporter periplasmic adaptor subunit [Cyanothece sp. SIO2G6]
MILADNSTQAQEQTQARLDDRLADHLALSQSEAVLHQDISPKVKPTRISAIASKFSRPWLNIAVGVALLGTGWAAWSIVTGQGQGTQTAPAVAALPPRPVEAKRLQAGTATQTLELIGDVEAADQATVRAQTSGTVKQVWVEVGDSITPGQPLAHLDTADQEIALAEAYAVLAAARSDLERLETGTRPEIIAQRQAELRAAQAREQEARINVLNVEALLPDLMAQRQAEVEMAKAAEVEANDNLERVRRLSTEGALSQRDLIEAQARATVATSDRLRATSTLAIQRTENQQSLARARASLDTAISERLRITALLAEATTGPRQEEIAAQRGLVQAAESAVDQAELALERAVITTDVSGVVSDRPINVGDYVDLNRDIATVVNRDRLDIFLDVPERYSGQVEPGTAIALSASALPNWTGEATVTGVVPTTDSASRRQRIRVRLNEVPDRLLPGMAITGHLEIPAPEAQFVVSRDALTRRLDQWVVFVVDETEQAQEIPVDLITDMGQEVAIASPNLSPGQTLVTKGGDGLRDGAPLQIINPS